MTTKEAIVRIKDHMERHRIGEYPHFKLAEALNMALAALRAQAEAEKNEPLTLGELREMDGEPVWVINPEFKQREGFQDEWALVSLSRKTVESVGTIYHFENYCKTWLAYRRKPEEGTK